MKTRPLHIVVACAGAGRIRRGYEAFALDLATRLEQRSDVTVELWAGGDTGIACSRRYPQLGRHNFTAGFVARASGLYETTVEHYSFALATAPRLLRRTSRPDLVVASERPLLRAYGLLRARTGADFAMLLRNGGSHQGPFRWPDAVQHMTPPFYDAAVAKGGSRASHHMIPYAFDIPAIRQERSGHRESLGLPTNGPMILSVGSIDRSVKRMDYVVRDFEHFAAARSDAPQLVLLGQSHPETPSVMSLIERSDQRHSIHVRSVPTGQVGDYYQAADVFAMASPVEAFGRVYVEALRWGLPAVVHDTSHTRWVLGEHAEFVDMMQAGSLASGLDAVLGARESMSTQDARHAWVYENYSWDRLEKDYLRMFRQVVASRTTATSD